MPSLLPFWVKLASATQAIYTSKQLTKAKSTALTLVILFIFNHETKGQCPPTQAPVLGDSCVHAPIFCTGLDGFCNTLGNINMLQAFPGCPVSTFNNDEWLAFTPTTPSISILITPSNCQGINVQFGMQGAIYGSCNMEPIALQCDCTENPFILSATDFVPGQVYYLVLDGCAGDICDYQINITEGAIACLPGINGPTTACQDEAAVYSIVNNTGIGYTIEWDTVPNANYTTNGDSLTVIWDSNFIGNANVCATVTDADQNSQTICLQVEVIGLTLPAPTGPIEICPNVISFYSITDVASCNIGQTYFWSLTNGSISTGSPTSAAINVVWPAEGIGEICLNNVVGTDTFPTCLAVNVLSEAICADGTNCFGSIFLCQGPDGLSDTLDSVNIPQVFPGCPTNSLNNPIWFSFIANSSTISMLVTPSNCQGIFGQYGMQGGIYSSCADGPLALQCNCTDSPFLLSSDQFIPGEIYYFFLDGCAGDICEFSIDLLDGTTTCSANIVGPNLVCINDTANYRILLDEQFFDYVWQPIPNATVSIIGQNLQVVRGSPYSNSTTQVCAMVTDINQVSQLLCIDVFVTGSGTPYPNGPTEVCSAAPSTYSITDIGSCTNADDYYWSLSNGIITAGSPTDPTIEITWLGQGIGEVCLHNIVGTDTVASCINVNIENDYACLPCDSLQAEIEGDLIIDCTTTSIDTTIVGTTKLPDSLALFQWTLNGVVVSTTPMVHVQTIGLYVFTVTSTLNGCSASDTLAFTQDLNLPIANAGPDMFIDPCSNPSITLDGSASSTGPEFNYLWEGPGIFEPSINATVSETGVYTLTVVNLENGCTATDAVEVQLLTVEATYVVETTPDSCHSNSGTATFIAIGFNPSILWSTGETTNTITGLTAGNYGVTVSFGVCESNVSVVIDSVGCTSTSEVFAGTKFQILPNPNNGQFTVLLDVASSINLELELVDENGRTVSILQPMKPFGEGQHRLDFQQEWLPSGTYYLLVKNEKKRMGLKIEVVR